MLFQEVELLGAYLIELECRGDQRGFFARTFCAKEFEAEGLKAGFVQQNISTSAQKGTLRGLHRQTDPHAEVKVVRCVRGAIFDVIVDVRPDSPTHLKWQGFELSEHNKRQLYVPEGFLHGFQALTDDVEVTYLVSAYYSAQAETGARYNDPAFEIEWPMPPTVISDKDNSWNDFER
ncbi:MAG: dTDP-4-dehydrorhamnose 3,5-epimerase [Hyphomonas sp.]